MMQHLPPDGFCPDDFSIAGPVFRFDGTGSLPEGLRGAVLLLGSFDGFHLGHAALVERGRSLARRTGAPLAVLQMDPHPRAFFARESAFHIATGAARALLLAQQGFDLIHAPRFDAALAGLAPEDFVLRHLIAGLGVSAVVAGQDFRFGRRRAGDADLLTRLGTAHRFAVEIQPEVVDAGARVSSSRIRAAIRAGDLSGAARLLGRDWAIGIDRRAGEWRVDPDQILPPAGPWEVEVCSPLGQVLDRTLVEIRPDRSLRLTADPGAAILRWPGA